MQKTLNFNENKITLRDPTAIKFRTVFHETLYRHIFSSVTGTEYKPYVDADHLSAVGAKLDLVKLAEASNLKIPRPSKKSSNPKRTNIQLHLRYFLMQFPEMLGLVCNTVLLAKETIANAEIILGAKCNSSNFIQIKKIIDDVNSGSWTRDKDLSESQSGVSTLGTISETLLYRVFESMVDGTNFFKVNASEVQSYGDFVLMCLPNNLWISVKSNFARERLLASGYNNDILGVGFFEDFEEFTGQIRVRNFQRAGFLAMYCPDIAVTEEQITNNTSTYDQIVEAHSKAKTDMPKNINGKPFIRRLSFLQSDLRPLLDELDIKKRFTVSF